MRRSWAKSIIIAIVIMVLAVIGWRVNSSRDLNKKALNKINNTIYNYSVHLTNLKIPLLPHKKSTFNDIKVNSKASILLDVDTFYVMHAENETQKVPIASTTKMATAMVVLENYLKQLNDVVRITSKMTAVEGSDIQLRPGEKMTVENLLNGLLIMSGNDTAYALAEYFGGKDKFVVEMNSKVKKIGAKDTEYKDPAGLDDNGYSTAKDLSIIAAYSMRNKKFSEIVRTPSVTIYSADGKIAHDLKNSNRMMRDEEQYYYPNAVGIKTGFTNEAGHVLVSAAEKNGHKIVAVVLHTNENTLIASAKESKKLLEWGFENWQW